MDYFSHLPKTPIEYEHSYLSGYFANSEQPTTSSGSVNYN